MHTVGLPILEPQTKVQYKDCVNEFQQAMSNFLDNRVDVTSRKNSFEQIIEDQTPPSLPPRKRTSLDHRSISRENSVEQPPERDDNKENIHTPDAVSPSMAETDENKMSVREAMMKFNRYASEEEAKIPSPLSKYSKKQDKVSLANFQWTAYDPSIERWIAEIRSTWTLDFFIAMTRHLEPKQRSTVKPIVRALFNYYSLDHRIKCSFK